MNHNETSVALWAAMKNDGKPDLLESPCDGGAGRLGKLIMNVQVAFVVMRNG